MAHRLLHRFALLSAALVLAWTASPGRAVAGGEGEKLDAVHHQADSRYLDFAPFGKLELPRIFVVRRADGSLGLDVFRSTTSAIAHGYVVVGDAAHGVPSEGGHQGEPAVGTTPARDTLHAAADSTVAGTDTSHVAAVESHAATEAPEASVEGEHASVLEAEIGPADGHVVIDLSITKHLFFAWLGMLIVLGLILPVAGRYRRGVGRDTAPRGLLQNLIESLVLFVRDDVVRPALGDKTDRYLPYLLTAFFFILTCNLLGLVPFGATATSNIMVTAVLATFTFIVTQLGGTKDYWKHILWPPGVPAFVKPILIPVEILGLFTKPFALAVRLFANMTAGHLVILSLIGLIFAFTDMMGEGVGLGVSPVAVGFALFIYVLELLVSFIQAYVFTMLSALFIGMAVAEHEHHHEPHDAHHEGAASAHELPAAHGHGTEIGQHGAVAQPA